MVRINRNLVEYFKLMFNYVINTNDMEFTSRIGTCIDKCNQGAKFVYIDKDTLRKLMSMFMDILPLVTDDGNFFKLCSVYNRAIANSPDLYAINFTTYNDGDRINKISNIKALKTVLTNDIVIDIIGDYDIDLRTAKRLIEDGASIGGFTYDQAVFTKSIGDNCLTRNKQILYISKQYNCNKLLANVIDEYRKT